MNFYANSFCRNVYKYDLTRWPRLHSQTCLFKAAGKHTNITNICIVQHFCRKPEATQDEPFRTVTQSMWTFGLLYDFKSLCVGCDYGIFQIIVMA